MKFEGKAYYNGTWDKVAIFAEKEFNEYNIAIYPFDEAGDVKFDSHHLQRDEGFHTYAQLVRFLQTHYLELKRVE